MRRRMPHRGAIVMLALVALALTGCATATADAAAPATGATGAAGSSGASADPVPVDIPGGVVATGTMIGASGDTLGEVTVTHDGARYVFDYPKDWLPDDPGNSLTEALSDSPFTMDECGADNIWQLGSGIGQIGGFLGEMYPDPTFFTSLLVVHPGADDDRGCWQPILAKADLTWTVPVTRPWVSPVDSGERDAARGAVEIVDGRALYTTASGDVWSVIAQRFGIRSDDLEWLNPIRHPGDVGMAYAGQVLNLDPLDRSDSESRRPQ